MNKVIMIGRTTKDVELRYTQTGKPVASFSIAVDKRNRNDGADFFDCVAWNATAEAMDKYVPKGSKISIVGRLANRNYKNRDGVTVYKNEIIADEVEFIDTRGKATPSAPTDPAPESSPENRFDELEDGELPF